MDRKREDRKRQLILRFAQEADKYLDGEIDEIRVERRGRDHADHWTTSRVVEYNPVKYAA